MNRKQRRDWLRSKKGQGGIYRFVRKTEFGTFGTGLIHHFNRIGKGI